MNQKLRDDRDSLELSIRSVSYQFLCFSFHFAKFILKFGFSRKRFVTTLLRISMENSRGGQVTVVGIPEGVCQNLRENSDFQGVSPKKIKIAYVHKV